MGRTPLMEAYLKQHPLTFPVSFGIPAVLIHLGKGKKAFFKCKQMCVCFFFNKNKKETNKRRGHKLTYLKIITFMLTILSL